MPGYPGIVSYGKPKAKPNPRARNIPKGAGRRQGTVTRGRGRDVTGNSQGKGKGKGKSGVIINPKNPQITLRNAPLPRHNPPKVVASPTGSSRPSSPSGRGGGGGTGGGRTTPPVVASSKPAAGGGKPVAQSGSASPNLGGIGFDPKKMAQTLTDLQYDAEIADIQRQIDLNAGNMSEAMKDIQGWAQQVEEQRATGAAASAEAWKNAQAGAAASDANIAQLFGGAGGGEGAAYANVNEDMLGAGAAADASFDARMAPILKATFADMSRRAQAGFGQDKDALLQDLLGAKKEKRGAYSTNLMQLMDKAWQRKQDNLQYKTAQQALAQARAMQGLEIKQGQQAITQGAQQIEANTLSNKAAKIALKKSQVELQKLQNESVSAGGLDWADPATGAAVAKGALTGALGPAGAFIINPKIAWQNAQNALAIIGAQGDPRALQSVWNAFIVSLRISHAKKRWLQYRLNKNGELVYDPANKNKK